MDPALTSPLSADGSAGVTPASSAAGAGRGARPGRIRDYFEGRAPNWIRLTSDEPVSGVRRIVREGRDAMAGTLLSWIPEDGDRSVLDAGCGPGEVSLRMARRGLTVTGVEIAPTLAAAARKRVVEAGLADRVTIHEGDASDAPGGPWQHVLIMDVLFHYPAHEAIRMLAAFADRAEESLLFTLAPRTVLLSVLGGVGSLFPRRDRAPAIRPVRVGRFLERLLADPGMSGWTVGRQHRVSTGFYFSHAVELRRADATGGRT
ncbi:MAG: magnesium protoporphyrin IX methyltransferase [Gemmatimonadales bacterium]|nr:MAG: magnesium protoporphyrin IX methyltransferase [Gemmatimonadales bacterium]